MHKTYIAKKTDITRACYLVNAENKILGRLASKVAAILRGKHKPLFTPNLDCGDVVIIINADKIRVTGKKMTDKEYQRYTGYPSGRRTLKLEELLAKRPTEVLKLAINRMIPKGPLGNSVRTKLRVYAGDKHPHQAQKPILLEI